MKTWQARICSFYFPASQYLLLLHIALPVMTNNKLIKKPSAKFKTTESNMGQNFEVTIINL